MTDQLFVRRLDKCRDTTTLISYIANKSLKKLFYPQLFLMRFKFWSILHSVSSYIIYETCLEFLFFFFLKKFFFLPLQYCIGFAIYQHESANSVIQENFL